MPSAAPKSVPPVPSFPELRKVKAKQWADLLDALGTFTDYQYVILDLTTAVDGFSDLLETCSRIFTITGEDSISQAKLAAYQALLKQEERTKIIAQTAYLQLPLFQTLPKGAADLGSGPVAAFVRRALSDGRR